MSKKLIRINQRISPSISYGLIPVKYNNISVIRAKSPVLIKRKININNYSSDEEFLHNNSLNKSINNQTFIYNNINFNGNQNSCNNLIKQRKNGSSFLALANNDITSKLNKIIKNSHSLSKRKINNYINSLFTKPKINNIPSAINNIRNKRKIKSFSKKKIVSINKKKKIGNMNKNINANNINNLIHLNTAGEIIGKNIKRKIINNNNYDLNINKNNKCFISKNNSSKEIDKNKSKITSKDYLNLLTDLEKKIINQIKALINQLVSITSVYSKPIIIQELGKIFDKVIHSNNCFSESNSKKINNLNEKNIKLLYKTNSNILRSNSDIINIEDKINILNNKFNKIEEENINLKNVISEKYIAFEDMKNSLKNFQEEIDKLKNNNNSNNIKNYSNNNKNNNLELKNISMRNIFKIKKADDLESNKSRNNQNNKCNDALYNKNNNKDNKNNNADMSLNNCFDPLSITFNNQIPISDEKGNNSNNFILYNCNEFSPTWKKSSEI